MKKKLANALRLGIFAAELMALFSFGPPEHFKDLQIPTGSNDDLKKAALQVLTTKCNVCHRKQNPFKIFSLKNMEKYAPKIYEQVFVKQRMPKGDEIKLTTEEYDTLENWLLTLTLN